MSWLRWLWVLLKMIYQILCCSVSFISLVFNIFWFICNLASATIPWCTLSLLGICVASKFIKLRSADEKQLLQLLGTATARTPDDLAYWPIANRGAGFDAPENSKAALRKCIARGYRNVLLDAGITACGELVITNRMTLDRAGFNEGGVACYTLAELRKINITELHPLSSHFEPEHIYTLNELAQFMAEQPARLTIFLHIQETSGLLLERLTQFMDKHNDFMRSTIIVCRSPLAIYQLRKLKPELICGLWQDKSLSFPLLNASTLLHSIYGAIFRNIIAPVIGISVVFLNKEEFNLHIAELWRNVGVRPFVYNVNSPNEKRYFQRTMKTQYLTDSLRSEPHLLMKA